jgi:hypothetical protein
MTKHKIGRLLTAFLLIAGVAFCQTFATNGTTTLSVNVGAEASIAITTATTPLTGAGAFANFTGTTNFNYKVRTLRSGGGGTVTVQITSDFGAGVTTPSVEHPPDAADTLSCTCTVVSPGTGCTSAQTMVWGSASTIASFGVNAHSARPYSTGNSVGWTLVNDPIYETGNYSATATFTISAT